MNHLKHLLFVSTLCSLILFTNCGEDEEAETTTITTGLSDNQDLLIGNWEATEVDGISINEMEYTYTWSFESNKSFIENYTEIYQGQTETGISEGSWSFDESDPKGMSLILEYPETEDLAPSIKMYPNLFIVESINNKKMSGEILSVGGQEFTINIDVDENNEIIDSTWVEMDTTKFSVVFKKQ